MGIPVDRRRVLFSLLLFSRLSVCFSLSLSLDSFSLVFSLSRSLFRARARFLDFPRHLTRRFFRSSENAHERMLTCIVRDKNNKAAESVDNSRRPKKIKCVRFLH